MWWSYIFYLYLMLINVQLWCILSVENRFTPLGVSTISSPSKSSETLRITYTPYLLCTISNKSIINYLNRLFKQNTSRIYTYVCVYIECRNAVNRKSYRSRKVIINNWNRTHRPIAYPIVFFFLRVLISHFFMKFIFQNSI